MGGVKVTCSEAASSPSAASLEKERGPSAPQSEGAAQLQHWEAMPDTSAKLQGILDDALRETFAGEAPGKQRARRRRQKLYGVGGGAPLPKLSRHGRRPPQNAGAGGPPFPERGNPGDLVASHASRPSDAADTYEHDAWYRMSYWESVATPGTTQPDRVFVGGAGKRHGAGVGRARREPWYGGGCPAGVASNAPFADAVRYGYRGAVRERRYRMFANAARGSGAANERRRECARARVSSIARGLFERRRATRRPAGAVADLGRRRPGVPTRRVVDVARRVDAAAAGPRAAARRRLGRDVSIPARPDPNGAFEAAPRRGRAVLETRRRHVWRRLSPRGEPTGRNPAE